MSIRSVRDYAIAEGCNSVLSLVGDTTESRPWDRSTIIPEESGDGHAQRAAVLAMLGVTDPNAPIPDSLVNERLAGGGLGSPLSAIANHASNPLGLDADLVGGKYKVSDDDVAVAKYVAKDGRPLWDSIATLAGGAPGSSGPGFDAAQKASRDAGAKHQAELEAFDAAHPDLPPQSVKGIAAAAAKARQVPQPTPAGPELHLLGGRFTVTVPRWETTNGRKGAGVAIPHFPDTGHFWFFSAGNIEITVTIIDKGGDQFAVKHHEATNVGFDLDVLDIVTGKRVRYTNPVGHLVGVVDWSPHWS